MTDRETLLLEIGRRLVNQEQAVVIVPAKKPSGGFWFGGGNMIADRQGRLYVSGRYRNSGDSRTGVGKGERGKELAIFRSEDDGQSFKKVVSFEKPELNVNGWEVLSIEGTAMRWTGNSVELYLSTEKSGRPFADGYNHYHKPGTGSWTIERITASSIEELDPAKVETVLENRDPRWFNVKDPFVYENAGRNTVIGFCTHPFNWASSNTGYAVLNTDGSLSEEMNLSFFPRGFCWDVGVCRGTGFLDLPRSGILTDQLHTLCFYDGAEAMRDYPQHRKAAVRPRGFSCEELGGLACFVDGNPDTTTRVSEIEPAFISPWGSGSSRYVDVLEFNEYYYVTWQQSQSDGSQPLVMNRVPRAEILGMLEY